MSDELTLGRSTVTHHYAPVRPVAYVDGHESAPLPTAAGQVTIIPEARPVLEVATVTRQVIEPPARVAPRDTIELRPREVREPTVYLRPRIEPTPPIHEKPKFEPTPSVKGDPKIEPRERIEPTPHFEPRPVARPREAAGDLFTKVVASEPVACPTRSEPLPPPWKAPISHELPPTVKPHPCPVDRPVVGRAINRFA